MVLFTRWFTMHGSNEIDIKNNVGLVCFGSGVFIEDGTETRNMAEHNLLCYNLIATYDEYYNTSPLYANVSADMCTVSFFWWKNNQNNCIRNVCANAPAPVIGIWNVPQYIGALRGLSSVCIGDPILKLPGLASLGNAIGFQLQPATYLSHPNQPNTAGSTYTKVWGSSTFSSMAPADKAFACWVPSYFYTAPSNLVDLKTHCPVYSISNESVPYGLFSENVFYQMFMAQSEFPEAIGTGPTDYDGGGGFETCPGKGYATSKSKVGIRTFTKIFTYKWSECMYRFSGYWANSVLTYSIWR